MRTDVHRFAKLMEDVLREKERVFKEQGMPLYYDMDLLEILDLLTPKMERLTSGIKSATRNPTMGEMRRIARDATHLGNFAMMLALKAHDQAAKIKKHEAGKK